MSCAYLRVDSLKSATRSSGVSDLLFHDTLAPHLAAYAPEASEAQQREFLIYLHQTLNAPSHPIRQRLDRIPTASPDLLAVIKQEGKV